MSRNESSHDKGRLENFTMTYRLFTSPCPFKTVCSHYLKIHHLLISVSNLCRSSPFRRDIYWNLIFKPVPDPFFYVLSRVVGVLTVIFLLRTVDVADLLKWFNLPIATFFFTDNFCGIVVHKSPAKSNMLGRYALFPCM